MTNGTNGPSVTVSNGVSRIEDSRGNLHPQLKKECGRRYAVHFNLADLNSRFTTLRFIHASFRRLPSMC